MKLSRTRLAPVLAGLLVALVAVAPGSGAVGRAADPVPPGAVGPFQVRNQGADRCLGHPAGDDRARVWDCARETYQYWYLVTDHRGRYQLANGNDGRCLTGWAEGTNGWSVWKAACDSTFGNADQLWYVHQADNPGPGRIANLFGRVLEPDRGEAGANGTRVEIWDNQGLPSQQWSLVYVQ
ncbi:RICIN domain-containing protein [Streptomyces sp. I05A-00742]|uniref:RICIN domain-containing protein n=1 Tax=Streptomyces sp. I05A-00742 TaxID=2732853 RepID=UPI001489514A|nr:RICIN domain-containing protein [Streptomyces sp. I05A-00742]